ncbi:MAG: TonB-dependent receptor plug domain-containing protein [Nibricoccus sp.]
MALPVSMHAQEVRRYSLPRGDASLTLQQFANVSGLTVFFISDKVAGEQTNPVNGDYLPREAVEQMLLGTQLVARQDPRTKGFVITRRSLQDLGEGGAVAPDKVLTPPDAAKLQEALRSLRSASRTQPTTKTSTGNEIAPEQTDIVLSPFVVRTDKDRGYYSPETLAGSRMNTNLADLAASISVINRAQINDFSSTDINDLLRYEANAEESSTYSVRQSSPRMDGLVDTNAGASGSQPVLNYTNANANRVRGLVAPGASWNYFPASLSVPVDEYNIQSVEINRGPNSLLFGVGSPAGIVNVTTARARLDKNTTRIQFRVDDLGSSRTSLSFNRYLIKGKLAIYGAFLWDEKKFERKPSYDDTRRQFGTITYKPFRGTVVRAAVENSYNANSRPNTLTPIDYVTQWNLAGRPAYDPVSKKITLQSTGQVVGPFISNAESPYARLVREYITALPQFDPALMGITADAFGGTPSTFNYYNRQPIFGNAFNPLITAANPDPRSSVLYVPGIQAHDSRPIMQIYGGNLYNWFQVQYLRGQTVGWGTQSDPVASVPMWGNVSEVWANPAWSDIFNRATLRSTGWTNNPRITNLVDYRYPGISDKSIYDWEKININASNFGRIKHQNYNIDFEQEITPELHLSAGWFRQEISETNNFALGQLNAASARIDVNSRLPDGRTNPFFGKPYVADLDPDQYTNTDTDDHIRAMLAYTPDFTLRDDWLRWLGRHQILGLWSRDNYMHAAYRKRLSFYQAGSDLGKYRFLPNPNNRLDGTRTGWNYAATGTVSTQNSRFYYLASPTDPSGVITSSGHWDHTSYSGNVNIYNYQNNRFEDAQVSQAFLTVDSPVRTQRVLQSYSGGITSYLWNDRLVGTFGIRKDRFKVHGTTGGQITSDGVIIPATNLWDRITPDGYFDEASVMNRFEGYSYMEGTTKTGGGVLRPFRGWSAIEFRAAKSKSWQILRDVGFIYNWSDNFDPPSTRQTDYFGSPLPKPEGAGSEVGVQFSALDARLFGRISWFKNTNTNVRTTGGVVTGRFKDALDVGYFRAWARSIAMINMGMDPTALGFGENLTQQQESEVQAAAEKIWGMPYNYYVTVASGSNFTQDQVAEGVEVQLNYNSGGWRNRFTLGSQETTVSNVLKEYDAWNAYRLPQLVGAVAADHLQPQYRQLATYTKPDGTAADLTAFWSSTGYAGLNNGDTPQDYYVGAVMPGARLSKDLSGQASPGQRKYRWSYNTGFDFSRGILKGLSVGGAQRWESRMIIGYYGQASGADPSFPSAIDISDTTRPIYDKANYYTDLFIRYRLPIMKNSAAMTLQLNVDNVFEDGHLQVIAVNKDASPYAYRIIDSRRFKMTCTLEF